MFWIVLVPSHSTKIRRFLEIAASCWVHAIHINCAWNVGLKQLEVLKHTAKNEMEAWHGPCGQPHISYLAARLHSYCCRLGWYT